MSCLDSVIRLFDRNSGELLNEYRGHRQRQSQLQSCFSFSDAFVLSGSEDNDIYIWNLVEASVVHVLRGHKRPVVSLDYHPTECMLLSASMDNTVRIWT